MIGGGEQTKQKKGKKSEKELNDTIQYQQEIIEKLINQLKDIELQKMKIRNKNNDYEELLEQNRHNFKELSIKYRNQTYKLEKYDILIQRLLKNQKIE